MHGSTAASRASISAAIKFCGQLVSTAAFGKKVVVASMMGVNDIARSEGMANADSNSLLPRSEMGGRTHFLLLVAFSESFLGQPNFQQILVQRDKEIRSRHAYRPTYYLPNQIAKVIYYYSSFFLPTVLDAHRRSYCAKKVRY